MDENEDDMSESNEDSNVGSNEKPMHLCLGAFTDRQIPTIRGPFSAASTKRKIKKMRDLVSFDFNNKRFTPLRSLIIKIMNLFRLKNSAFMRKFKPSYAM
jgi:hypothetical protein